MDTEIENYINGFSPAIKEKLLSLREAIANEIPEAVESFSYKMPGYKYKKKPLVYFAAYEKHIGVYALPASHSKFKEILGKYKQGKGSVQFQHSEDLPLSLILEMVKFRKEEIEK